MDDLNKIIQFIRNNDNFVITSHIDPDGDNIASQLALFAILKSIGKNPIILDHDPVPERYEFLLNGEIIHHQLPQNSSYSALFVVDVAVRKRIGNNILESTKDIETIINIDHHRSNSLFGKYNFVDGNASSATVMLYRLAKKMNVKWNTEICTRIYSGLMTDTGGFRFQNTNEESFAIAKEMVQYGADAGNVAYNIYSQRPLSVIKLLQEALSTLQLHHQNKTAMMRLTQEQYTNAGALPEHSEGLINYASSVKGIHVAILIREYGEGIIRVSLRSNGLVDVDKIARVFSGGGHKNAAGCRIKGTIDYVEKLLLDEVEKFLSSS